MGTDCGPGVVPGPFLNLSQQIVSPTTRDPCPPTSFPSSRSLFPVGQGEGRGWGGQDLMIWSVHQNLFQFVLLQPFPFLIWGWTPMNSWRNPPPSSPGGHSTPRFSLSLFCASSLGLSSGLMVCVFCVSLMIQALFGRWFHTPAGQLVPFPFLFLPPHPPVIRGWVYQKLGERTPPPHFFHPAARRPPPLPPDSSFSFSALPSLASRSVSWCVFLYC